MEYDKNVRYRVVESNTKQFNVGDVIKQVKRTNRGILVGFNYRQSLYVDPVRKGEWVCWAADGETPLIRIELSK